MLKRIAITFALCLCAGVFVAAGIHTPTAPPAIDTDEFCAVDAEDGGQKKTTGGRCAVDRSNGACASPGSACGTKKGVCTTVATKRKDKFQCKCL